MNREARLNPSSLPLEGPRDLSIILEYDVLITDIADEDFTRIARELGISRLTPGQIPFPLEIDGMLYGYNSRVFVPLVVEKRGVSLNVLFLVDTGSPGTFLRQDTLHSLGYTECVPDQLDVSIQGDLCTVRVSCRHYENVDLLGQDFLRSAKALLTIDYAKMTVKLILGRMVRPGMGKKA